MNKDDIFNEETFFKYCYEKALSNNIRNWNLKEEDIKKIDSFFYSTFKEFEEISKLSFDEEIADYERHFLGELLEKNKSKSLKLLKSCTPIFIARLEYLIIKKVR